MSEAKVQIIGIDQKSKNRGVGRYVQALEEVLPTISPNRPTVINPFLSLTGAKLDRHKLSKDTRAVAVIHDLIPLKYRERYPLGIIGKIVHSLNKMSLKKYSDIVTVSNTSAKDIEKYLGIEPNKIHVIHSFSPLSSPKLIPTRPANLPNSILKNGYVIYVGDVNWHKNIVQMVKACQAADIDLICVGKGFEMLQNPIPNHVELQELADLKTLLDRDSKKVHILGFVQDAELAWLYTNALANILVSHDEGFGYSYIEAGYYGTPSILSDISIFREISQSMGAFFVDQRYVEGITKELIHLKNSPEIRQTVGQEAKTRSIYFSREKFGNEWRKLLS